MKSQQKVYIFLYSLKNNLFDSIITRTENLHNLQLRARFNTHRDLNLFAVLLTPKQADTISKKINSSDIDPHDIFTSMNYCVEIGY